MNRCMWMALCAVACLGACAAWPRVVCDRARAERKAYHDLNLIERFAAFDQNLRRRASILDAVDLCRANKHRRPLEDEEHCAALKVAAEAAVRRLFDRCLDALHHGHAFAPKAESVVGDTDAMVNALRREGKALPGVDRDWLEYYEGQSARVLTMLTALIDLSREDKDRNDYARQTWEKAYSCLDHPKEDLPTSTATWHYARVLSAYNKMSSYTPPVPIDWERVCRELEHMIGGPFGGD